MKFSEEKAREVIAKFGLSESTIPVWRMRDSIPDKYFKADYKPPEQASGRVAKKIKAILGSEKLNLAALAALANISRYKLADVARGKSDLSDQDCRNIRKAINTIRVEAKKYIEAAGKRRDGLTPRELESFRRFLKDTPELVIMKIFNTSKVIDWRNGKPVAFGFEDQKRAIDSLAIFILETSIPET